MNVLVLFSDDELRKKWAQSQQDPEGTVGYSFEYQETTINVILPQNNQEFEDAITQTDVILFLNSGDRVDPSVFKYKNIPYVIIDARSNQNNLGFVNTKIRDGYEIIYQTVRDLRDYVKIVQVLREAFEILELKPRESSEEVEAVKSTAEAASSSQSTRHPVAVEAFKVTLSFRNRQFEEYFARYVEVKVAPKTTFEHVAHAVSKHFEKVTGDRYKFEIRRTCGSETKTFSKRTNAYNYLLEKFSKGEWCVIEFSLDRSEFRRVERQMSRNLEYYP